MTRLGVAAALVACAAPFHLVGQSRAFYTSGRVEPASVEVLSTPDSGLIEPVKQMMLASQFSAGRLKGAAVRVMVQMGVDVRPPRLSAAELVGTARRHVARGAGQRRTRRLGKWSYTAPEPHRPRRGPRAGRAPTGGLGPAQPPKRQTGRRPDAGADDGRGRGRAARARLSSADSLSAGAASVAGRRDGSGGS